MIENKDTKERNFVASVIFVIKNGKVLLGKKKDKIGVNRYNGPGGEFEEWDPSIEWRATLEMWQEIDIICWDDDLQKIAIGYFTNIKDDGSKFVCEVHFFFVEKNKCKGQPKSSKEMEKPEWFNYENFPFDEMMAADRYWIPEIFKGRKIIVRATLRNKQSELVGEVEIEDAEF